MKYLLCIPSLNAGELSSLLIDSLRLQSFNIDYLLLIDSESDDNTVENFRSFNFAIYKINRSTFNHGATRQLAVSLYDDADIIIYMTQDSILASPFSISKILEPFEDSKVGAVCGRQLPHDDASSISAHARFFNYPAISSLKTKDDISSLGIRAAFISNSFAAYRRKALIDVGGFPCDVIFGEDTYVAAKMLLRGWKVAYAAEAVCCHSHNYSMLEEFKRYFDIGVFHSREAWFIKSLGKPEGEGKKFVTSELRYLMKNAPYIIPFAMIRTCLKLFGYKIGQREQSIPRYIKRKLSMNKGYWND